MSTPTAHAQAQAGCVLCDEPGGVVVWRAAALRVIAAAEPDYPGFCRVIWNAHVSEFSELSSTQQQYLMQVVGCVERVVRAVMAPHKINLASLGNQVPHLHWHVIPRYADDAHFPAPVWAAAQREVAPGLLAQRAAQAAQLPAALVAELTAAFAPN